MKKDFKVVLIIVITFFVYVYNQKIYRPKVYSNIESNELLVFVLGILPNFLGAIMTLLTLILLNKFLFRNKNKFRKRIIQSVIVTLGLVIFMELERWINGGSQFDFFDILASIVGVIFCLFLYKKELLNYY